MSDYPQRYQGPVEELREGRDYAIAQICVPNGNAAVAANAPAELILSMYRAAHARWMEGR